MPQYPYLHHEVQDETSLRGKLFRSMREIVFGLEDGIVSTLGAITGIAVGTNDSFVVILSGVVIIFVESLSMAAGSYLSSKSQVEVVERMLQEERAEIATYPKEETKELEEFYRARGFEPAEVDILVKRVTANPDLWLEEMAFHELKIIPEVKQTYAWDALAMWFSYIVGGSIALLSYFIFPVHTAVPVAIAIAVVTLFVVGVVKGSIVQTSKLKSGVEMVLVSLSAAGIGYLAALVVSHFFGV